jgi:hypothetical protein
MAKKRREKEEGVEPDFKLPKFDEAKFLTKERRNIKTLFISFIFGIVISFVCFGFWTLLSDSVFRWELVLLVGVFNISWLKYIFGQLNIDLTEFGRRGWFSSFATYFFTWLILFAVLVNPPFYDDEAPYIENVVLPQVQELGGTVLFAALIMDNSDIVDDEIKFTLTTPNNTQLNPDYTFQNNIMTYKFSNPENVLGKFSYRISATDVNGKTNTIMGNFSYDNNAIVLTTPENGSDLQSYTPIEIRVNTDIFTPIPITVEGDQTAMDFRAYYQLNNGNEINVSRLDVKNRQNYRTTPEYVGWLPDSNVTLTPQIEVTYYFINNPKRFNNTIVDTSQYQFQTKGDPGIGIKPPLIPPVTAFKLSNENQPENTLNYYIPVPRAIGATPGFEIILFILSLIVVVLLIKYRTKER